MATSVTSQGLVAGSDKVILAARPFLEFTKLFSTNYAVEGSARYNGIAVNVLAASSENFGAGAGYTHSTNTIKPATVTLENHRKSTWTIGDKQALTNELSPVWAALAPKAGEAIGKFCVETIMALLTYTNRTDKLVQSTVAALADFTAIWGKVVAAGYDPTQCTLILRPTAYAALLSVLPAYVIGDDQILRSAMIGQFLGFKAVVPSPNASADSAADATAGFGFVVPEGAIACAARIVEPVREGGNLIEFGTFSDDATGFPFGTRVVVDADQGTCSWSVDVLFGAALSKQSSNGAPGYLQLATA